MRIRIIGAGSIGLLLAGKLAASGAAAIELVTKTEEQALRLNQEGVTVKEPCETVRAQVTALSLEQSLSSRRKPKASPPPDWTLLAVKQQAIDDALLSELQALPPSRCGIVCFQNGIGHVERLAAAVSDSVVYIAVTTEGARRESPFEVDHTGIGTTEIGLATGADHVTAAAVDNQKKLVETLVLAGFDAAVSKQIHITVWNKLLINAAINPLTAILRKPNGALLQSERTRQLMQELTAEGMAVAAAVGIVPAADLERRIAEVCRSTARNRSSMLQDLETGRITENEWISGAIVRLAAKYGVPVPVTETIYRIVYELERGW
jgi:2-dehydropantoate 2-reductase